MYQWIVFLHIASAFTFFVAHGAAANVAWQLRRLANAPLDERALEQVRALLNLSANSRGLLYNSMMLIVVSGVVGGVMGGWWGRGWIWTALGVLLLTMALMSVYGLRYFEELRVAVGLPSYRYQTPDQSKPKGLKEVGEMLRSRRPLEVTAIGFIGLLVVVWLMVFKPF